jgi:hypothetical protein
MPRLCSKSSRSYPGRPARLATLCEGGCASCMATCGMTGQESAEAIVGAGSSLVAELETSLAKRGRTHPTEGPNMLQGRLPNEFPEHARIRPEE